MHRVSLQSSHVAIIIESSFTGLQLQWKAAELEGTDNIRKVGSKNRYTEFPSECDPLC
jgi:hypothetical protein